MEENKTKIPYSSYFKGNDDHENLLPEYIMWFKENHDKLNHINYHQCYQNAKTQK